MPRAKSKRPSCRRPQHNEVTVPAIHFVKTSTGDDIFVFQIEQAVGMNRVRVDLSKLLDRFREMLDSTLQSVCNFSTAGGTGYPAADTAQDEP